MESVAKKLIDTADKKVKESEKQKNATQMKALPMESNAFREKSEKLQKRDMQYSTHKNSWRSWID